MHVLRKPTLASIVLVSAWALTAARGSTVVKYCTQTKPTSVANCIAELGVTDTSVATGVWQATKIARHSSAGVGTSIGIFIYSHGVGIGQSLINVQVPMGNLCVGLNGYKDFKRSAPPCPAAQLPGAVPGCNAGPMETALACNQGALGIAVGDDVNVQFWYRDPYASGTASFSNAIFYTAD